MHGLITLSKESKIKEIFITVGEKCKGRGEIWYELSPWNYAWNKCLKMKALRSLVFKFNVIITTNTRACDDDYAVKFWYLY